MKAVIDFARLVDLARAEAESHEPRTPARRAAAALWVSLVDTGSVEGARRALSGFAAPAVETAALDLLGRLATQAGRG